MQLIDLLAVATLALVARAIAGTWLHPSAVFAAVWTITLGLASIPPLPPSPWASLIIMTGLVAACVTASIRVKPGDRVLSEIVASHYARVFVLGGAISAVVSVLLVFRANGIPWTASMDLQKLLAAASDVTARRYTNSLQTPLVSTILLAWLYGAAFLAPYVAAPRSIWPSTRIRWRSLILMLAPTVSGAFYGLATTAKTPLVIAAVLTGSGFIMTKEVRNGGLTPLRPRAVLRVLVSIAALFVVFVYVTATRRGGWTPGTRRDILDNVLVYVGGGVPAYEQWLRDPGSKGASSLHWGAQTFGGFDPHEPRVASLDVRSLNHLPPTNLYSILRPLTEDFGFIGVGIFLAAGCLAAAVLYRRAVTQRSEVPAFFVSAWLALTMYSLAMSIASFTVVVAGVGAAIFVGHYTIRFVGQDEHQGVAAPEAVIAASSSFARPLRGFRLPQPLAFRSIGLLSIGRSSPSKPRSAG